jgi:hypothetical protein
MVTNATALERTISALILADTDAALTAACRTLAVAVDDEPGKASLWREYLEALRELVGRGSGDGDGGDALSAFLDSVRAPVLDPTDA